MTVSLDGERVLCRFLTTTYVHHHHRPVYEAIVEKAWRRGLAGATVLHGEMGFVRGGELLRSHPWRLSVETPVVVEIVEDRERLDDFLTEVNRFYGRGLITLERARVLYYRAKPSPAQACGRTASDAIGGTAAGQEGSSPPLPGGGAGAGLPDADRAREGGLLRVFTGGACREAQSGRPLQELLVEEAHAMGLGGAVVLGAVLGYGRHSVLHGARPFSLSNDLPVVIEVVDRASRIGAYLAEIRPLLGGGLATFEKVRLFEFGGSPPVPGRIPDVVEEESGGSS